MRGLDSATLDRAPAEVALVAPEVVAGPGAGAPGDRPPADGDASGAGGERRFQAFEAVTSMLTAAAPAGGLLVVLDDLQWADPASLQLLVHLSRGLAGARLLALATYRDTETGGRVALQHTLAALAREAAVTRLRLRGLTEQDVASHLAQLTGRPQDPATSALVSRRSQGNPFYVAELARLLPDPADGPTRVRDGSKVLASPPAGVRDAVRARLAHLTPPCRELVSAASVLGADVDAACLAAVADREVRDVLVALDEAAAAGIVTGAGRCRFTHDLVREAARLDVATVARLSLHDRMARYLLDRGDVGSRLPEVAFHCVEALPLGEPTRAVEWAERAAAQAMTQLAWEEAASLYGRAVAVADGIELLPADRCRLLLGLARAQVRAHDVGAARTSVLAAADIARNAGDIAALAQAAVLLEGTSDFAWAPVGRELCEQALAALPEHDSPLRARLLAQRAVDALMVTMRDARAASEPSEAALAMAERTGDHAALVAALRARQIACGGPDGAAERLRVGERMLGLGERGRDDEAVLWGRVWRFDALVQLGEIDRAEAELDLIAAAARRLRSPLARWHLLRSQGAIAFGRGRFDEALAVGTEAVELAQRAGHEAPLLGPLSMLALVCAHTGRSTLPVYPSPRDWPAGEGLQGAAAVWYLAIGRREDARRISATLSPPETAPVLALLPYLAGWAELADAFDDRTIAATVYQRLLPYADLFVCSGAGALGVTGSARLPLGIAAGTTGRLDDAVRHLRAAAQVNDRAGLPPFAAHARYQLARHLARRRRPGDREEAAALATSAAAVAERLGMEPLRRAAGELGATLAGQPAGPLTRREREIAVLVSQGLTNRQIAAAAHISERTAENHVQHILGKLGFATRAQIAAWVASESQSEYRR